MTVLRHLMVDRDGVLNVEEPGVVLRHPDQWRWEPAALEALEMASAHALSVSVVTNQAAVARGVLTVRELELLHDWLATQILSAGVDLVGIFSCVHDSSDRCGCRKPEPRLLLEAMSVSGIGPDATVMVGDDLRDLRAADAAGVSSVLVRTGKGSSFEGSLDQRTRIEDDLCRAVEAAIDRHPDPAGVS